MASDPATETLGQTKQAMVGGTVSGVDQDSVVFVLKGTDEACSGTLIAPNLVLTARHCVSDPDDSDTTECVGYGPTIDPSQMGIKVGASANFDVGDVVATGVNIYTPQTVNMCGYDVALIQLNQDIPNAKISPMRFTALAPNEPTVAVGYGVDENNNTLPSRMQRSTTVLGVGPKAMAYQENDGSTFNYSLPQGDVATGESTCFGDSGGPLFDAKGNVVAMTSRGPFQAPEGGDHGNSCADMLSVYSGAKFNEQVIRDAATAAGHPLPSGTPAASTQSKGTGDVPESSSSGDDDDDDDTSAPAKKSSSTKKSTSSSASDQTGGIPSSGACSATPGRAGNGAGSWGLALGVAALVAAKRRRERGDAE